MSRRVVTIVLVALTALFAAAGAALAFPAYAPEVGVATGPSTQDAARTSALALAWEDDAAGGWNVGVGLTDRVLALRYPDAVVPSAAADQRHPAIGDDLVVYEDDRSGDWDLYASKWRGVLGTYGAPDEQALVTAPGDQTDPDISDNTLVYVDDGRGNPDIAVHHLDSGETAYLTTNPAVQADPSVDGKWVVWADHRNGNWDIYAYDLDRGVLKRLTTNRANQTAPQVGQNKVVYQDHRNGQWDVYQYDLANGSEKRLTTGASDQTQPSIDRHPWGDRPGNVVYVDDRRDAGDIYLRDGATGIVKPVCTAPGAQTAPSIDEEHVVWTDGRAEQRDVYACTLAYPKMNARPRSATPPFNAYGGVSGSVTALGGGGVAGGVVYAVCRGTSYKTVVKGEAGAASGTFSVLVGRLQRKATVTVRYAGSATSLPIKFGTIVIKPKASLSRPVCRYPRPPGASNGGIVMTRRDKMIVSGTLRPRHASGSKAVTLLVYKLNTFGWQLDRKVKVAVRNAGANSSYQITLGIDEGYRVRYKVQAWHSDADHAETLSAFSAVLGS